MKKYSSSIPESELDWKNFINSYKLDLENSLRFRGFSESDIDDLVQESFLAIWKAFKRNMYDKDMGSVRAWVNRVTRNKSIDFLRREAVKLKKMDNFKKIIDQNYLENNLSPSLKSLLKKSNLSKENQNLITDYFCGDLNNKSLSQKYNMSLAATEKRISRLKSELRRIYRINYVYEIYS